MLQNANAFPSQSLPLQHIHVLPTLNPVFMPDQVVKQSVIKTSSLVFSLERCSFFKLAFKLHLALFTVTLTYVFPGWQHFSEW